MLTVFTAHSNGDDTSELDAGTVIGGSLGVAILSVIIFMFCVAVSYIRWSCKKKTYLISNKEKAELGSDISMTSNPSYEFSKQNKKQEYQMYDYATRTEVPQCSFQDNKQDTIKLDANPSYGEIQERETLFYDYVNPRCDITIQPNPSYSSNSKISRKIAEDHGGYVKTDEYQSHSVEEETDYLKLIGPTSKEDKGGTDGIDKVKINPNPSYESVSEGVIMEDNPSYNKIKLT